MWKFIRCSATSLLLLLCADLLVGAVINHQSAPAENSRYAHVYVELEHVNDASSTFTAKVTATLLDYKLPTVHHTSSPLSAILRYESPNLGIAEAEFVPFSF